MKCATLLSCIVFAFSVKLTTSENFNFFPHLPVGQYRINFKGIMHCVPPSNDKMHFNYYLSKTSATTAEIKGNASITLPIDDSYDLEFKMSLKDSIGGWKDNAYTYKTPKACSALKKLMGKAWLPFIGGLLGTPGNASCPIPKGLHISTGADTSLIEKDSEFPKQFFYGTYKFHTKFLKNKDMYGCFVLIVEIKRPWEKE